MNDRESQHAVLAGRVIRKEYPPAEKMPPHCGGAASWTTFTVAAAAYDEAVKSGEES